MLSNLKFIDGFEGEKFIVTKATEKRIYDKDGNATSASEGVKVTAVSQKSGEISIVLAPFSQEKLEKCANLFGTVFTMEDLVAPTDCKISCFNGALRVTITAADIAPGVDL